jgi:hypothetical protein
LKNKAITDEEYKICKDAGNLASLNCSWQSEEGTYGALGMAGIEPTPPKSECDWTPLSP